LQHLVEALLGGLNPILSVAENTCAVILHPAFLRILGAAARSAD
jgi:hypothetical protein